MAFNGVERKGIFNRRPKCVSCVELFRVKQNEKGSKTAENYKAFERMTAGTNYQLFTSRNGMEKIWGGGGVTT